MIELEKGLCVGMVRFDEEVEEGNDDDDEEEDDDDDDDEDEDAEEVEGGDDREDEDGAEKEGGSSLVKDDDDDDGRGDGDDDDDAACVSAITVAVDAFIACARVSSDSIFTLKFNNIAATAEAARGPKPCAAKASLLLLLKCSMRYSMKRISRARVDVTLLSAHLAMKIAGAAERTIGDITARARVIALPPPFLLVPGPVESLLLLLLFMLEAVMMGYTSSAEEWKPANDTVDNEGDILAAGMPEDDETVPVAAADEEEVDTVWLLPP